MSDMAKCSKIETFVRRGFLTGMVLAALIAFSVPSLQARAATVTLTPAELVGLTITIPMPGVYPLDVIVTGSGGSASAVLNVTVSAAPPTLAVEDAAGFVGKPIPLNILTDAESITITIPDGATLSSGQPVIPAIATKAAWDTAFASRFGDVFDVPKLLGQGEVYDETKARFQWHGNYWLRAFTTMAETFDDPSYLDKAVNLIDYMLFYRDDARAARGEIDILAEPYDQAPPFYLNNRDQVAPGWRLFGKIKVLDDGQITNGIMRFVRLVYGNPNYQPYQAKAEEYLASVIETVDAHTETYVFNRHPGVSGSYYWPDPDGTGLYSNPVPYNQEATMGITLLLLDDVLGGGTEYARLAEGIVGYWFNFVELRSNDAYVWAYAPYNFLGTGSLAGVIEDIGHGHIDVGFLWLAYNYGVGDLTVEDMVRLVNTWIQNVDLGDGELADKVDGSGTSTEQWNAGFDWIDLDPVALRIAVGVYNKHYASPQWSRPFLGWAEILKVVGETSRAPEGSTIQ